MIRGYRAGQKVKVRAGGVAQIARAIGKKERLLDCMVLCGTVTADAYIVAATGYNLVAVVDADDIVSPRPSSPDVDPSSVSVVFFGNGDFALPVLRRLVGDGYDVRAVVTNPDSRKGRRGTPVPTAVAAYGREKGLNVLTPPSASEPSLLGAVKRLAPDIGIIVEYGILPKALHRMPGRGTINLHSSLLPEYRGASTVSSAIRDGKHYTGLTVFSLSDEVDGGDIINNMLIPIEPEDNSEDVLARMRLHGPDLVCDAVMSVCASLPAAPQRLIAPYLPRTDYASKVFRRDLMIDWGADAEAVRNFVRAYAPAPSAWTDLSASGGPLFPGVKIHRLRVTSIPADGVPGTWRLDGGRMLVSTGDYMVSVECLQPQGRQRMSAVDFLNGLRGRASGRCSVKAR